MESISVSSDQVELAKIASQTIRSLAWPLAAVISAWIFKNYIAGLLTRVSGLELGALKLNFEQALGDAEIKVGDIAPPPATDDTHSIDIRTTNLPPHLAILDAWRQVEIELTLAAERAGINFRRGSSVLYLMRILESKGILGRKDASLLNDLRVMRNNAVHFTNVEQITDYQAQRFAELAEVMANQLRNLKPKSS